LNLSSNEQFQLPHLAIDSSGKIRGGNTDAVTMTNLKPETKARIEATGMRMLNRLELPPGRYQLRVAAHDTAGGNVGSVQYDLEVADFVKTPFSISGLVMTSPFAAQTPTVRPDDQIRAALPASPVALRAFPPHR